MAGALLDACRDAACWPLPGSGLSMERLRRLARLCRADIPLGRLVEAHADALAILTELGCAEMAEGERRWGVWAAGPAASVRGSRRRGHWTISGTKRWCSGASLLTHALVDARTETGQQLFAVSLCSPGVAIQPPSWVGSGMARTDTRTVDFTDVTADPVGSPGEYLSRPGFWAGAIGVAACWHGGTVGVADVFWDDAASRESDPHRLAHLGAVQTMLAQNQALLERAARELDDESTRGHAILARIVRSAVAAHAVEVVDRVGRALGPAPLAFDAKHAAAITDLLVYVRQEHAERDLERLGADLVERRPRWTL